MLKLKFPTKLKTSSECTTAVVGFLNLIIKIKILLSGTIGPSKHGPTPSSTGLTGAPANCWLLCMSYVCYLLNHNSCESLKGQIPLTKLYGVTPDISIIMMCTFHQSVYFASHNHSFPFTSEEKHAFWIAFGEHVGDAITHKLLDSSSNKILYRSAVHPADGHHPNKH